MKVMYGQKVISGDLLLANQRLAELRPELTQDDRNSACTTLSLNPATVSLYTNMKGRDLATALKLLEFFRNTLSARKASLQQTAAA